MGVFDSISKSLGISKGGDVENIEEYMDAVEMESVDVLHEAADFYVKPIALESESDTHIIMDELKARNIILLNVSHMKKNAAKLKMIIDNIKSHIGKINGDIARIDEDKILLTPSKVKIVKTRKR
ncbi:MAG: cell division protein SepF [Candidatus Micrarchaeota archaeon]